MVGLFFAPLRVILIANDVTTGLHERHRFVPHNNLKQTIMENKNSKQLLTGSFRDRATTETAFNDLRERGYAHNDINMVMSDDTRKKHFGNETKGETEIGTKALSGAGTGSAIGGTIGAIAGVIAAIGTSVLIPGLGLVVAGPLAAGLAGAGAGGLTGGVIGALVGAGIPEERARIYENDIKDGGIVLGVNPKNDEDAEYLQTQWNRTGDKVKM